MKLSPRDLADGPRVPPADVVEYLRSTGWRKLDVYSADGISRAAIWGAPEGDVEIYVPLLPQALDYNLVLARAIDQIARVEERRAQHVLADLRMTRSDVVRVRCVGAAAEGPLPLAVGSALFAATADLVVAAASAAVETRPAYPGRRAQKVQDFCRRAGFGQTEEGSFVVRVVIPLPLQLPGRQMPLLPEAPVEPPFARRVTEKLLSGVKGAHHAATQAMLDGSLEPFGEQIERGVSADLCKALSAMGSHDTVTDAIEISVSWSRALPLSAPRAHPIGFTRDALDLLGDAATFLSHVEPREEFQLTGYVTGLRKEPNDEYGDITVLGRMDGGFRRVKVKLSSDDYELAHQIHNKDGAVITMTGDLRKEGSRYQLDRPHRVREIPEASLDD